MFPIKIKPICRNNMMMGEKDVNKNVGKRAMAMLMSVLMLGNSVLPASSG